MCLGCSTSEVSEGCFQLFVKGYSNKGLLGLQPEVAWCAQTAEITNNWFDKDRDLHPEPARAFTKHPSHSCPAHSYFYLIFTLKQFAGVLSGFTSNALFPASKEQIRCILEVHSSHCSYVEHVKFFPHKLIFCHLALCLCLLWLDLELFPLKEPWPPWPFLLQLHSNHFLLLLFSPSQAVIFCI